ncbi:MAG: antitoxin [Gaiellaceae bacterium]
MRTTVTLDPDVEALVKRLMRERGLSFKEAVNTAIRAGAAGSRKPYRTRTFDMGEPLVDVTKALRLAGELEDEEILRRLAARK